MHRTKKLTAIRLALTALAATAMMAFSAPAMAASPSEEECAAQGGTFTKEKGQVQCVVVEEGKNERFTDETTTSGQGNIDNKQEEDQACEPTGSGKCPPGQF